MTQLSARRPRRSGQGLNRQRLPSVATILLALVAMLAPPSVALAQPTPPRLVVFEGFYNPG